MSAASKARQYREAARAMAEAADALGAVHQALRKARANRPGLQNAVLLVRERLCGDVWVLLEAERTAKHLALEAAKQETKEKS